MRTLGEALGAAVEKLRDAGVASPEVDARLLAAHLTGAHHLALGKAGEVPAGFDELIRRRAQREPLQHILGEAPFGHLDVAVGPGVFIPRPETEVLADWAVRQLRASSKTSPVVMDLCTGSGAMAQYIASLVPRARVVAVEKQASALDFARRNAPDVTVLEGDVTADILRDYHGRVDLVVSNPPYVPQADDLEPEVYADPHEAVFAGADGMSVIPRMVPLIERLLVPGGLVGIEHDETTAHAVCEVLAAHGFVEVATLKDLAGRPRFATASKLNRTTPARESS
ncbi:peptide chain release factor N(5)-glutamine methyltransferase [Corynebacterium yudongzhengii]|uniref:Release factor glutamine methyltransferase n=1 Tax=Corynebacterium yudongzhengii TaxID=2080740 RepID=A0A2U1T9F1_9CORY|nr:peptide chain release factor N(5)-glutamine methyltransferase [Corynebacterium yudongzhengii]AWB82108.1 peptide chain release factor N(5)-glutamine methyltransferase [Corynebacterium yudongzhengii]PWC02612.1 peptide chain release factor N(5)-glutamine methyltransferase [Corynebacterium yudongzhengii]